MWISNIIVEVNDDTKDTKHPRRAGFVVSVSASSHAEDRGFASRPGPTKDRHKIKVASLHGTHALW